MVQCEKKTKLIKGQLAKPSKWDTPFENDYRQTVDLGAAALKQALPDTKLVDAAWLAAVADKGGLLPRCQDLPAEAVVTLEDLEKGDFYGLLAALVISCPWLDAGHPDQDGEQLARLAFVLKAFATKAGEKGGRVGVFWDYVSVPQRSREAAAKGEDDRTAEDLATYDRAVKCMNTWYGHPGTHVLLVDTPLPDGHTNTQPYVDRGWCRMEQGASSIVKIGYGLISLSKLTGREKSFLEVCKKGQGERAPPMAPAAFAVMLESGVESGEVRFTHQGDVPLVTAIHDKAFMTEMHIVTKLNYSSRRSSRCSTRARSRPSSTSTSRRTRSRTRACSSSPPPSRAAGWPAAPRCCSRAAACSTRRAALVAPQLASLGQGFGRGSRALVEVRAWAAARRTPDRVTHQPRTHSMAALS
jgi:hypothetical protein